MSGLYKHFVTDRIMDGGNMTNPDARSFREDETLLGLEWTQRQMNDGDCFRFDLTQTDGVYTISGCCADPVGDGALVERENAVITADQWAQVEQCLRNDWHILLRETPHDEAAGDETGSTLCITSKTPDGNIGSAVYDGEKECELADLLREILTGASEEYAPTEDE